MKAQWAGCMTKKILSKINNKYIFFWIEDHVLISNLKYFENVIKDIITKNRLFTLFIFPFW